MFNKAEYPPPPLHRGLFVELPQKVRVLFNANSFVFDVTGLPEFLKQTNALMLPGYLEDDRFLRPFGNGLNALGAHVHYAGGGINFGPDWGAIKSATDQLDEIFRNTGERPVYIVAHSAGGVVAHYLASKYPEKIAGIVSMGSPYKALEHTRSSWLALPFFWTNGKHELLDDQSVIEAVKDGAAGVRALSIYSGNDGAVCPQTCLINEEPGVSGNFAVQALGSDATHYGMQMSQEVFSKAVTQLQVWQSNPVGFTLNDRQVG